MRTIYLYPHIIAPIIKDEPVTGKHFRAIWLVQQVANSLMRMFDGKDASTYAGTVQFTDTITFDHISDVEMAFILSSHPYIREKVRLFIK